MNQDAKVLPETQYAVQLVGPGELRLNRSKAVHAPGPRQIVARIEAVGLCFSDLKLLKQFDKHVRKGPILTGIDPEVLAEIPSYVAADEPTVPGHEAVVRIVAVGSDVRSHQVGERCLVQTDYRWLLTHGGNASFGYNFEGALQQYVLMDERVVITPEGERFLIPVREDISAAAIALTEPWACVENSYANPERRTIKPGGRLAVVAEAGHKIAGLAECLWDQGPPASIFAICADAEQLEALRALGAPVAELAGPDDLEDEFIDDIVYFGAEAGTIEAIEDKLSAGGIINIVTGGRRIAREVSVNVGRLHYGMTRWVGTFGESASASYETIPANGEIRPGESILIVGAGGPMGQMHVVRALCEGTAEVSVTGTDFDDERLDVLGAMAEPLAEANGVNLRILNPQTHPLAETFSYFALMAPIPSLVASAIRDSRPGALINVFAGIPAGTFHQLDLNTYIENRCFMFGTSGSVLRDMKAMLEKVQSGRIDTNCSVAAVSGMAGAVDGIAAIENRTVPGKIVVYPALGETPLIELGELGERFPTVAEKLQGGIWSRAAEDELLKAAAEKDQ